MPAVARSWQSVRGGQYLAAGPLLRHEVDLLATRPHDGGTERAALNAYFQGQAGARELSAVLDSGAYRIEVPEEGALLAVAWLARAGHGAAARAVREAIAPWTAMLRFYPAPAPPEPLRETVHLQDVARTIASLEAIPVRPAFERQRETVEVWLPLYDRLLALFAESVDGPMPELAEAGGRLELRGGRPCWRCPYEWRERAAQLLQELRSRREVHGLARRPDAPRGNFHRLVDALELCINRPAELDGKRVGRVRAILAQVARKRGLPGSSATAALRERQARQIAHPRDWEIARVLISRLKRRRLDDGLDALDPLLGPITAAEAWRAGLVGQTIPPAFRARLARSWCAAPGDLIAGGVITSCHLLACIAPQIAMCARAARIADPALRRLDALTYRASRVRGAAPLDALPWVQAVCAASGGPSPSELSAAGREALRALVAAHFPGEGVPGALARELGAPRARA